MARRRYLVMYDICDPRRLRQVHSVVKGFGHHLQYSVFLCDLAPTQLVDLKWQLGDEIDHFDDSVVIVDLGEPGRVGNDAFTFLGLQPKLPTSGAVIL